MFDQHIFNFWKHAVVKKSYEKQTAANNCSNVKSQMFKIKFFFFELTSLNVQKILGKKNCHFCSSKATKLNFI
jgi:hypothetical protein